MTTGYIVILAAAGFCAAVLHSIIGFGTSLIMISVLPFVLPNVAWATAITSLCGLTISSFVSFQTRKHINLKLIWPLFATASVSLVVGVKVVAYLPDSMIKRVLGVMLILLSIHLAYFSGKVRIKPTVKNGMLVGIISGLAAGMFSVGGPPTAAFMINAAKDKNEYRATNSAYFVITGLISNLARWQSNIISNEVLQSWAISIIPIMIGLFLGNRIFKKINTQFLSILVYIFMGISGAMMLIFG